MEKCISNTNYMNDGFIIKNPDGEDEIIHIPYNLNNLLVNESDIIQILNRFKTILKQKKVKQYDFAKNILKFTARTFYNVLTLKCLGDQIFFQKEFGYL